MAPFDRSAAETTTFSSSRQLAIWGRAARRRARDPGLETLAFVMRILALHGNRCAADASATDPTSRACRSLAFRIPPWCPLPRSTHRAPSFSSPRSQNGEVFATRLAPHLRKLRERVPEAEIVFLDAPLELPRRPGDELAMRTWWRRDGGGGGGRAFEGWETSLATLRDAWCERGPFRGVIGFSQGAAVGFLLSLLAESADRDAGATIQSPSTRPGPTTRTHPSRPSSSPSSARDTSRRPLPVRAQGVRPVDGARVGIAGGRSRSVLVIAGDADDAVRERRRRRRRRMVRRRRRSQTPGVARLPR